MTRRAEFYPPQELVEELELRCANLRGRVTFDVPELADWRLKFRRDFFRQASLFALLSVLHLCVASLGIEPSRTICILGFCVSFPMLFFCEFRARDLGRQLKRRAAEQVLRDLAGMRG